MNLVEDMGFRFLGHKLFRESLDVLHEEFVLTLPATDVLTGQFAAHAQSRRAIRADDGDTTGLGPRGRHRPSLEFLGAGRHEMVRREGAELMLAMLALNDATAISEPDLQGDETVGTNRHKM